MGQSGIFHFIWKSLDAGGPLCERLTGGQGNNLVNGDDDEGRRAALQLCGLSPHAGIWDMVASDTPAAVTHMDTNYRMYR